MFSIPERLKAAMEARLHTLPINARHLIVASGISFEESPLPQGVYAVLSRDGDQFRLTVTSALGERAQNLIYAKSLAHLLMHAPLFEDGQAWTDGDASALPVLYPRAPIDEKAEAAAIAMAAEILLPTVTLRQKFLYTQGNIAEIAAMFQVPKDVVHRACVRRNLLDERAVA